MKKSTILIQENNAILMIQIVGKNRQLTWWITRVCECIPEVFGNYTRFP